MKLCECGCGKEVKKEEHRFIYNHHNRGKTKENDERIRRMAEKKVGSIPWNKGLTKETSESVKRTAEKLKKRTKETSEPIRRMAENLSKMQMGRTKENDERRRKQSQTMTGRTKETHEGIRRMAEKKKGRTKETHEGIRRMAEKKRGMTKENCESVRRMANTKMRKDITKEKIHKTVEEILNKYGKTIGRTRLTKLVCNTLNCSRTPIDRVCKNMDTILTELNIEIPRSTKWKQKENFGIELAKELYGEGKVQKWYYHLHSRPDFIPNNTSNPIIDIKSTLSDIRIEQKNKYEQIRKDVRFMVFEDIGRTDLPEDRILYMKEIIKTFPNNKRLIFQERYEMIKNDIPITQLSLNNFLEVEK